MSMHTSTHMYLYKVALAGSDYTILDGEGTTRIARFDSVEPGSVIDGLSISGGSAEKGIIPEPYM